MVKEDGWLETRPVYKSKIGKIDRSKPVTEKGTKTDKAEDKSITVKIIESILKLWK